MAKNHIKKYPDKKLGRPVEWTEEKSLELGQGLVDWMMDDESHVFWMEYIVIERGLPKQLTSELSGKYDSFRALLKRAKDIQELRLLKKEGKGEIKSLFVLKNHHGYVDKAEIKQESINYNYSPSDIRDKTEAELLELLQQETNTTHK